MLEKWKKIICVYMYVRKCMYIYVIYIHSYSTYIGIIFAIVESQTCSLTPKGQGVF